MKIQAAILLVLIGLLAACDAPSPQPSVQQDSTEWKTYKNDIYGFEVDYPPYGFLTKDTYDFAPDLDFYTVEIRIPSPPAFIIEIAPKRICDSFDFNLSNTSVAGIPAIKVTRKYSDSAEYRDVHFITEKNCFSIYMLGPGFEDAEKMLTTFRFK